MTLTTTQRFSFILIVLLAGCQPKAKLQIAENDPSATSIVSEVTHVDDTDIASGKGIDFSWTDHHGKEMSLKKDYRGKVVMINFWATWCGPCNAEIPDLVKLQDTYRSKGLEIIGISVDTDTITAVSKFVAAKNLNYPVVLDIDEKLSSAYGRISVIPTTFVIDRNDSIRGVLQGMITDAVFNEKIRPLLEPVVASK